MHCTNDSPMPMCTLQVPSLLDGWNEARDKFIVDKDNFKAQALERFQAKTAEYDLWHTTVDKACADADSHARIRLEAFEKAKKHVVRDIRLDTQVATQKVPEVLVRFAHGTSVPGNRGTKYYIALHATRRALSLMACTIRETVTVVPTCMLLHAGQWGCALRLDPSVVYLA